MAVLKQAERGMAVSDVIRQMGILEQTLSSLEEAVCRPSVRSGPGAQTATG